MDTKLDGLAQLLRISGLLLRCHDLGSANRLTRRTISSTSDCGFADICVTVLSTAVVLMLGCMWISNATTVLS